MLSAAKAGSGSLVPQASLAMQQPGQIAKAILTCEVIAPMIER
jgi:hypothetical protein